MKTRFNILATALAAILVLAGGCKTPSDGTSATDLWLTAMCPIVEGGVATWVSYDLKVHPDRQITYGLIADHLMILAGREAPTPGELTEIVATLPVPVFEALNLKTTPAVKQMAVCIAEGIDGGLASVQFGTAKRGLPGGPPAPLTVIEP